MGSRNIGLKNWGTLDVWRPWAPWTRHTPTWKHKVWASFVSSTMVLSSTENPLWWSWRLCRHVRDSFWWKSSHLKVCPWIWSWPPKNNSNLLFSGYEWLPSLPWPRAFWPYSYHNGTKSLGSSTAPGCLLDWVPFFEAQSPLRMKSDRSEIGVLTLYHPFQGNLWEKNKFFNSRNCCVATAKSLKHSGVCWSCFSSCQSGSFAKPHKQGTIKRCKPLGTIK